MFHLNASASNRPNWQVTLPQMLIFLIPVIAAAAMLSVIIGPDDVYALCDGDALQQTWLNVNPTTRSIRRVDLFFPCDDLHVIGVGGKPQPTPSFVYAGTARLYGACHPTDCDWGDIKLYKRNGTSTSNNIFIGKHQSGFATRQITMQFEWDKRVELRIMTHFTDNSGRADYTSTDYFFRA